jgi:large subunit ribosomal protein L29
MSSPAEIRALKPQEIALKIREAKEELFKLRFQKAIGQLENVSRSKQVRREVARLKTILRELQLAQEALKREGKK